VKEIFGNWTGVTGVIGVIAFVIFALPFTPPWLSWPCLGIAVIALGRLIVVGDRHHERVSDHLDMDNDDAAATRARRIQDLLGNDRRP
jgi:hypothetical protein